MGVDRNAMCGCGVVCEWCVKRCGCPGVCGGDVGVCDCEYEPGSNVSVDLNVFLFVCCCFMT